MKLLDKKLLSEIKMTLAEQVKSGQGHVGIVQCEDHILTIKEVYEGLEKGDPEIEDIMLSYMRKLSERILSKANMDNNKTSTFFDKSSSYKKESIEEFANMDVNVLSRAANA